MSDPTPITPATDEEIAEWKVGLADLAKRYTLRGSEVDCVRLIARIEAEKAAKDELARLLKPFADLADGVIAVSPDIYSRRTDPVIVSSPSLSGAPGFATVDDLYAARAALAKHKEPT